MEDEAFTHLPIFADFEDEKYEKVKCFSPVSTCTTVL